MPLPGKSSAATAHLFTHPGSRLFSPQWTVPRSREYLTSSSKSSLHTLSRAQNQSPLLTTGPHIPSRNHFVAVMPLPSTSTSDPPIMPGYPGYRNNSSTSRASAAAGAAAAVYGPAANVRRNVAEDTNRNESNTTFTATTSTATTMTKAAAQRGFDVTPIPKTTLGNAKPIKTAACLVIGDEILNGKTMEKNSHYFAKYCFDLGIDLKRVEVIPDDEAEIIAASRRMVEQYDFVITTGGIGPTHDDITYASLAKAFDQNLKHHDETLRRMNEMNKHRSWMATMDSQQREATKRMALFPEHAEVLFIGRDIWVSNDRECVLNAQPVVRLQGKLCVFPGIPALFQKMLDGLTNYLPVPPPCERPLRIQVFTERPESMIAPYLTSLQARVKADGIQVGSYPVLNQGVFVCLIGRDLPSYVNSDGKNPKKGPPRIWLAEVAKEVEREIGGRVVSEEEVAEKKEAAGKFDPAGRPIKQNSPSPHHNLKSKI
ncbi:hypothetical protein V5O48_011311 [Marasmius crinis-equi]|uniref:MoaB/Mog domain-containing protein n=1 Tax=Marasmius crinis-equi TaxID=585013 RepID=A0ABR3F5Y2_9AGAR